MRFSEKTIIIISEDLTKGSMSPHARKGSGWILYETSHVYRGRGGTQELAKTAKSLPGGRDDMMRIAQNFKMT